MHLAVLCCLALGEYENAQAFFLDDPKMDGDYALDDLSPEQIRMLRASLYYHHGIVHQYMDNTVKAVSCFKRAVTVDVTCFQVGKSIKAQAF